MLVGERSECQGNRLIRRCCSLLTTLKNALNADIPPTAWACLWLSDIDKLEELVNGAKRQPVPWVSYFQSIESQAKIVQKCEVYRLSYNIDLLMLYRKPTRAQAFWLLNSSAGVTFPNSCNATGIPSTTTPYFTE
jgi:hypothetical protein